MEDRSESVGEHIEEAREKVESRKKDSSVPGLQPAAGELAHDVRRDAPSTVLPGREDRADPAHAVRRQPGAGQVGHRAVRQLPQPLDALPDPDEE